jgi:hypothetical protein
MHQTFTQQPNPQVSDLVLDPLDYSEALRGPVLRGSLAGKDAVRLALILPVAIAQLDAIGDSYGALALANLYKRIVRLHTLA